MTVADWFRAYDRLDGAAELADVAKALLVAHDDGELRLSDEMRG